MGYQSLLFLHLPQIYYCKMQQDSRSKIAFEDFKGDPFALHSSYCDTKGEGAGDSEQRQRSLKEDETLGELMVV